MIRHSLGRKCGEKIGCRYPPPTHRGMVRGRGRKEIVNLIGRLMIIGLISVYMLKPHSQTARLAFNSNNSKYQTVNP